MQRSPDPGAWISLAFESWRLWAEASMVVWLRTARLAQGGALAQREAARMVSEKWLAAALLGPATLAGRGIATPEGSARKAVRHYRTRVSANRRRLSPGASGRNSKKRRT
jgi:hypothetical protein